MKLDNTEKVKKAKQWLHAGKTPRLTNEITTEPKEPQAPPRRGGKNGD
jgi:hypothetical protein